MGNNDKWTPSFGWYKRVYPSIPEDRLIELYDEQSGNKMKKVRDDVKMNDAKTNDVTNNVINVGVIGVGVMGEHHISAYSRLEKEIGNIHIVGIADINYKRAKEVADKYGIEAYSSHIELIQASPRIDAISICVPTSKHKEVTSDCIARGVSGILVEKPIADDLNDALGIVNGARKMGVKLLIGHVERFNPIILKMKEIIDSGKLGHIVSISARRVGPFPPRVKDAGVIVDLAVHDIDIISYLFDSYPTDVYAIDGNIKGMKGVELGKVGLEDRASIMMRFNDGRVGIIETNWLTPHKVRKLDIVGSERVAYLDYTEQTVSIHGCDMIENIKLVGEQMGEPLIRELMHFINVVNDKSGNIIPLVTGEDGVRALRIALAATESYKTGNVVKLGLII